MSEARDSLAKHSAALVAAQRSEEKGRLALLYVLFRADRRTKGEGYFQGDSGLAEMLGVEQLRLNTWVEHLISAGLIVPARGAFGGVGHRPIGISQAGIDLVERAIGRTDPGPPVRRKAEKFGILDAQGLLKEDLRGPHGILGTALLYIDVDNFKTLNSKHTETLVDRTLLPELQRLIVSVVAGHGFAYAEGGDEVIVLLNNSSPRMATVFAETLREQIQAAIFSLGKVEERLTVSIGVSWAAAGATGVDLQAEANEQKRLAKESFGRNCSVYKGAKATALARPEGG